MKKWLLILGIITCMSGLTACGQKEEENVTLMTAQEAKELAGSIASTINQVVLQQGELSYIAMVEQNGMDASAFEGAFASWKNAYEDMGNYVEIMEITSNSMEGEEYNGTTYAVEGTIAARMKGDKHNAILEIIYEDYSPVSLTVNVEYTLGETMEKAFLNTLLGMGTVFSVLILISLVISCFNFIPAIQAKFTKKSAEKETVGTKAVENTIAQIIEKEEELSDDTELVAVIAAAIAASEGAVSADGFVVRSIRRKSSRWQRA